MKISELEKLLADMKRNFVKIEKIHSPKYFKVFSTKKAKISLKIYIFSNNWIILRSVQSLVKQFRLKKLNFQEQFKIFP